jgi:hypothetical protein
MDRLQKKQTSIIQRELSVWLIYGVFVVLIALTGCTSAGSAQIGVDITRTSGFALSQEANVLYTATAGKPAAQVESTPTPTQLPELYDNSVLSEEQRDRLYRASLEYVANTEGEAIRVAQDLQFLGDGGHPATFCGPLSISILRDAGLVDRYTDLYNFWLLNPRESYTIENILEKTFPRNKYLWYRTETPINEFDFSEFPLYSGDFLYLYAGPRGTFEHMVTVSRVDKTGRVYAITAETYNGGYLISEVVLYDPNDPGVGYFYDITNPEYSKTLGMTGFGGFQLWRPTEPIPDPSPEEGAFRSRMDKVFEVYGGEWHVLVKEIDGKVLYALDANEVIHPASVIKVPQAMLFFEALRERDIDQLRLFLVEHGIEGLTYEQLLHDMLVYSDEDATEILLEYIEDYLRTGDVLEDWGYQYTTIKPRRTTVTEITKLFEELWLGERLTEEENQIILEYLAEYSANDDTRLGVIRGEMPEDSHFYSKRGSLVVGQVIVSESAILEMDDQAFVVSIFGYRGNEEEAPNYDELEEAIEDAAWVIWGYLEDYK